MQIELDISDLIPQKDPFVMIDALTYSDEKITRTRFQVRDENVLVKEGEFQESGLLENIAQTAAARVGYIAQQKNQQVPIGFIGAMKNVEIVALPKVYEQIETEIQITNQIFGVTIIKGHVKCNQQIMARCEMKIVIPQTLNS